jgi:hypothetical protein
MSVILLQKHCDSKILKPLEMVLCSSPSHRHSFDKKNQHQHLIQPHRHALQHMREQASGSGEGGGGGCWTDWSHAFTFRTCAAKAIFYCPSMNSHRPRSQNISKESTLNPEKDSSIKIPRSHVSLEKSSQNYKLLEN